MVVKTVAAAVLACALAAAPMLLTVTSGHAEAGSTADIIVRRMNEIELSAQWKADGFVTLRRGATRMQRVVDIRVLRQGTNNLSLRRYRFVRPADIEGTGVVMKENSGADNDMWLYLPALGNVRRLASSKLSATFAGTDFAYADLMPLEIEKYSHAILTQGTQDGQPYVVVQSTPLTPAYARDIGYGRIRTWIYTRTAIPFRVDYDDVKGQPLKTQTISAPVASRGGNYIMTRREITMAGNGRGTLLELRNLTFNAALSANDFSPQRLSN